MLNVEIEHLPGAAAVLRPVGELDQDCAAVLEHAATEILGTGRTVLVMDCAALGFADSTGLNVLLRTHLLAAAHSGALHLARPQPGLLICLTLTGLDTVLRLHPDLPTALSAAGQLPAPAAAPVSANPAPVEHPPSAPDRTPADTPPRPEPRTPRETLAELTRRHIALRQGRRDARSAARPGPGEQA
ncbi:STAS domain-containing protein [Streptacidiphilus sp. PAMC 29251]